MKIMQHNVTHKILPFYHFMFIPIRVKFAKGPSGKMTVHCDYNYIRNFRRNKIKCTFLRTFFKRLFILQGERKYFIPIDYKTE